MDLIRVTPSTGGAGYDYIAGMLERYRGASNRNGGVKLVGSYDGIEIVVERGTNPIELAESYLVERRLRGLPPDESVAEAIPSDIPEPMRN